MNSQEWGPGQLLELSGSYWKTCALHAGVKLCIFTVIGSEKLTSEGVAARINADSRAVFMLLNALSAIGLLVKSGDLYSNTPSGIVYLSKDSPKYIGYMILHHRDLMFSWTSLDEAISTGRPVRERKANKDEKGRENFLMGMFNIGMNTAPSVASKVDLSSREHLLDIGGGPGTYAIHFCLSNSKLKATVCDLETTRSFAEKTIKKFGLENRIDFKRVDYLQDDIPGKYDVAWLSHILHGEGPDECKKIIQKVVAALTLGGTIMIHEFILDNTMDSPLFPALFSLNMLLGTEGGQSYSEKQLMDMLAEAGVKEIKRLSFRSPAESGIIAGKI